MNNLYEFIEWCFRDETAGMTTIIVLSIIGGIIIQSIKACRKK